MDAARQFEAVIAAGEVGIDQIFRRSAIAGLGGRLGGAFDDQVGRVRQAGEVGKGADVAVSEGYVRGAEAGEVELGSAAVEGCRRR